MNGVRAQRLRLLAIAGVLAPAAMVLAGFGLSWLGRGEAPDLFHPPGWREALLGALTAGLSMGMVTLLGKVSKSLEQALRQSGTRVGEEALRLAGYPVMLVVVTAAGLGEEVLFRGGVQPLVGVVPAALLFGFSHGGWRKEMWAYAVAASLSGLLFGAAYHLTGRIWVPIIAHALHNILSTLMLGRRVEVTREGFWPRIRLVPEAAEEATWPEEEAGEQIWPEEEAGEQPRQEEVQDEPVAEPLSPEADGADAGADDGNPADRPPE